MVLRTHTDPAFNSSTSYAYFVKQFLDRDLVELKQGGDSYLGVFFCRKEERAAERNPRHTNLKLLFSQTSENSTADRRFDEFH